MSAHAATFDPRDLRPPREQGTTRAMLMAVAMHALLVAGLWVGVAWRTEEPVTIEAELWSSIPQYAAPAPRPAPAPEPTPEPPRPAPAPRVEEPQIKTPDIALERKREQERLKLEEQKKLKDEQKKKDLEKKKDEERFNRQVQQLAAMASETAPAGAPSTGNAAQTSGPKGDPTYASRVAQRIRGNTVYDVPADLAGNPAAQFRVDLDPAGYVINVRKLASSGIPNFDDAVERAIRKSEPFPPDASGKPPRSLDIQHRPKDH